MSIIDQKNDCQSVRNCSDDTKNREKHKNNRKSIFLGSRRVETDRQSW